MPSMDKKALEFYESLAVDTYTWMKESGYERTEEEKEYTSYGGTLLTVTVHIWAKQFAVYLDEEGEPTSKSFREWQHVKLAMIHQGMAISLSSRGHYLGWAGEQATNIVYNIAHALARIGKATKQMEKVRESGKYLEVRKHFRGRIDPEKVIGLIEATKGVSALPHYQFEPTDALVLLVEKTEGHHNNNEEKGTRE